MITSRQIKEQIEAALPDASVEVTGDDGVHFEAIVVSPIFKGKNRVAQHKMVYRALGDKMKADIHALSIQTRSPKSIDKL